MGANLNTFGEFLRHILKLKNISISKLAKLTNTKSTNTIQRLLKDESSIDIINDFRRKLIMLDPLSLTPLETRQLEKSVEVSKVGKNVFIGRKLLFDFFKDKNIVYSNKISNVKIYSDEISSNQPKHLKELFKSYLNFISVKIIIINSPFIELTNAIVSLMDYNINTQISIEQLTYINNDYIRNVEAFISIYKLLYFKNYSIYHNSLNENFDKNPLFLSNIVVVEKRDSHGNLHTDLMKFTNDSEISILIDNKGNQLFNFYSDNFNSMKSYCQSVKKNYYSNNHCDKLIAFFEHLAFLEKTKEKFLIENSVCFSMVNIEIITKVLNESNYLELSENPKAKKLLDLCIDRCKNFVNSKKLKTFILTKKGLVDFCNNLVTSDHPNSVRHFTSEEVKIILEFILKQTQENVFYRFYLLKDTVSNVFGFNYHQDSTIILHNYTNMDDFSEEFVITSKPLIDIFDDFIRNELIKNHTLSETETINFIKELLSK